jgi:hypothetical protein
MSCMRSYESLPKIELRSPLLNSVYRLVWCINAGDDKLCSTKKNFSYSLVYKVNLCHVCFVKIPSFLIRSVHRWFFIGKNILDTKLWPWCRKSTYTIYVCENTIFSYKCASMVFYRQKYFRY